MVLRTKSSLQRPECPSMGFWWEVKLDLFIGIREGFTGEVIFILNFERDINS